MVLDAVRARCDHTCADQIYLDVRAVNDSISRGTVYRNLNILVQQGEILKVKMLNTDRYECHLYKHYHLICTECGSVSDVPLSYHEALDIQVANITGDKINRHRIIFEGLCPKCIVR